MPPQSVPVKLCPIPSHPIPFNSSRHVFHLTQTLFPSVTWKLYECPFTRTPKIDPGAPAARPSPSRWCSTSARKERTSSLFHYMKTAMPPTYFQKQSSGLPEKQREATVRFQRAKSSRCVTRPELGDAGDGGRPSRDREGGYIARYGGGRLAAPLSRLPCARAACVCRSTPVTATAAASASQREFLRLSDGRPAQPLPLLIQ